MLLSVFDLFTIGLGPSSSHTVGPMKAARRFARALDGAGLLDRTATVEVELHGSLGATGPGHGSDRAVVLGLLGEEPEEVDLAEVPALLERVRTSGRLRLLGRREIAWREADHLHLVLEALPAHPNALRLTARDGGGVELVARTYLSVGGGFVVDADGGDPAPPAVAPPPLPFEDGAGLLARCAETGLSVSGVMLENERTWRSEDAVRRGLLRIWETMQACAARGCHAEGPLPGGLHVRRRAPELRRRRVEPSTTGAADPLSVIDEVSLYALAVAEENAAGGRVVTAPTNGAAGIVPALLHHYTRAVRGADAEGVVRFLLAAGAVGLLFKRGASISGAEVGCQGEVGVACSMAAGGLAEALGGSPQQVEAAAEIGMEHLLGLTCDPVGGLVQVPCIERNAMGAVQALAAARLALQTDGRHVVSLDEVIRTMRDTGADMKTKYKETARGGLALNVGSGAAPRGVHLPSC